MRFVQYILLFLLYSFLCFCHCSPESIPSALRLGIITPPSDLDPAYTQDIAATKILPSIFETLVQYEDSTLKTQPALAESVESSPDAITWTFYLRKGVLFHDGTPFNAEAVKVSFERLINPQNEFYSEYEDVSRGITFNMIDRIEILNEHTVRFHLKYPYVPFHHTVATYYGASIVSPTALRKYGSEFRKHPVGTGPFRLKEWNDDKSLTLSVNESYWGTPPRIKEVKYIVIPRTDERANKLIEGSIQVAEDVGATEIDRFYLEPDIQLVFAQAFGVIVLGFNCQKDPFTDVRIRKAFAHAFDKEKFVYTMLRGRATVASVPLPPPMRSHQVDIELTSFDPDAAKKLLHDAGYPNGFQAELWCFKASERAGILPLAIQKDLKKIGIDINIRYIDDWDTYDGGVMNGEAPLFVDGWKGDTADPDSYLYPIFHSRGEVRQGNLFHYSNVALDDLMEQARRTVDRNKRMEFYDEAQRIILSDQPCVFIGYYNEVLAVRNNITDIFVNPLGFVRLDRVEIAPN